MSFDTDMGDNFRAGFVALVDRVWANQDMIPADGEYSIKPIPPFVTYQITASNIHMGHPDVQPSLNGGAPITRTRIQCKAQVSLNGFGDDAGDWILEFITALWGHTADTALGVLGISNTRPVGGMRDLSALLDDRAEVRMQQDIEFDYQITTAISDLETGVELEHVNLSIDHDPDTPDNWHRDEVIDLP